MNTNSRFKKSYYIQRMRVGNVFVVYVCVCVGYNFWMSWCKTPFLVWWYILTITKSSPSIKVIRSRSYMQFWLPWHQFNLVLHVQDQGNKLGQGHLNVQIVSISLFIGKVALLFYSLESCYKCIIKRQLKLICLVRCLGFILVILH